MMKKNSLKKAAACILIPASLAFGSMICMAAEVSTDVFRVKIPDEITQICDIVLTDNGIDFYDKVSQDKGMGGYVASIETFASLGDYGMMPQYSRGGEIDLEDGTRLDIVIQKPSDVQFFPEDGENYKQIAQALETQILPTLEAVKGVYVPQDEVDTTWIYEDILNGLVTALEERTDRDGLEEKGYSYVYAYTYDQEGNPLDKIGYAFMDVNSDGYQELLIGSVDDPAVYDMYAWMDGEAAHLFSSGERSMHYVMGHNGLTAGIVCQEASGGAALHETTFSYVVSNSAEMMDQNKFIYDASKDEENPWFIDYGFGEPEAYDEETWNTRMSNYGDRLDIDYQPLSSLQ